MADSNGKRKRHASVESAESDDYTNYIPTPPDGGYGWVIVACSLVNNIIVDGIGYSFGVFLLEFVEYFKEPKSKVAFVGSLLCGTYLTAGPVVSALVNRFGCRKVAVFGSFFASGSFVLAMFSPSIDILILTYGIMGGFGLGMIYLPSIVMAGYYFEKKRALATGIAVCGSGIGTFIFAPLAKYLLDEFDWKNALLIIAGIILQSAICGMLMRPLEPATKKKKPKKDKKQQPREKNIVDRIKEQTKRQRSESESSAYIHSVNVNNSILERVMEAKIQRETQLQEDDSEIGSLPSTFFIKGPARHGSRDARLQKLSLSDRGDVTSTADSHPGSPGSVPRIVVQTEEEEAAESAVGDGTATEVSEYVTPPTSPQEASSPESPGDEGIGGMNRSANMNMNSNQNAHHRRSDPEIKRRMVKPVPYTNGSLPNAMHKSSSGPDEVPLLLTTSSPAPPVPSKNVLVHLHKNGSREYVVKHASRSTMTSERNLAVPKQEFAKPMYRKDIFYSGSVLNIAQFRSQPNMRSYITSITSIPGGIPPEEESCLWRFCPCIPTSIKDILQDMMDVSLLKDVAFDLLCFGNILCFLGFYVPFVYLVDRAIISGIDKGNAAFLVSVIGITNCVGRILAGWIADLPQVSSLLVNNVALLLAAVSTAIFPFCTSYTLLVVVACFFGIGIGAFVALSSIVICDLVGLEKLTNAFGLLTMFRGFAAIAGPPLAGYVYDMTQNYDKSFFLGGGLLLGGTACHFMLQMPCLKRDPVDNMQFTVTAIDEIVPDEHVVMGPRSPEPEHLTIEEAMSIV
ncbi:monocarboxylate transporter 14-like [Gigantopelta aegis]|uniref:monocarboxylate transporter 14-like n=1 Tax=Gigantopelta aegis TaxID=1735272 RepID=UPI001B88772B|nr:monocarboxylate transporter 14-like [Gigantopelta aegis]XP_041373529.1 monocarboxylate transporter 14-like [Gigantopelta aegis]